MKNRISILLCAFFALNSITGLYGQKSKGKITIEGGVVVDVHGEKYPVANAFILIDGKNTGTVTNSEGFYKIKVKKEINKIGVYTSTNGILEEDIDGRDSINFTYTSLVPYQITNEVDPGNEPVDIGYQKVKKRDVMAPVEKIDGEKLKNVHYNNIYDMIRGKVPGVEVNGSSIMIRSASSLTSGTQPLFVVDGVPVTSIDHIDPQMVRSIEVLKGSSAAIYGTRGSNGVILINLKKGNDR
jgi:TonB-dependent SusC/RagA subfamily outer membrane receptor